MKKKELKEINLKLKLPKKLEQHLTYLETVSKRPREFIVKEALIRYLEDAEDLAEALEKEKKGHDKTFTTKELLEHLNLKEIDV